MLDIFVFIDTLRGPVIEWHDDFYFKKSRIIADSLRSAGIIDLVMDFLNNTKVSSGHFCPF